MILQKFHITIIILLIWNFSFTQEFIHYDINNGLPSNHIYKIVQGKNKFIWIITDNGMVRYNGKNFTEFTTKDGLPTNDIWEIATNIDGKVWYFCKGSKIGYIENGKVFAFSAKEKSTVFFPLEIIEQDTTIFFRSEKTWYFLNENNFWENVEDAFIKMPQHHKDYNKLYLFTENLKKRKNIQFSKHPKHIRQKDSLLFWVTETNFGLYNLKADKWLSSDNKIGYPATHSSYARVNFLNNQLQITDRNYCIVLDRNFKIEQSISIPNELNSHHTTVDKTGNLWCATLGKGMYKMPSIKRKINYHLSTDNVSSIHNFGNKIIACVFDKGYYILNKNTNQFEPYIKLKGHIYPPYKTDSLQKEYYIDGMQVIKNNTDAAITYTKGNYFPLTQGTKELVYFQNYLWGYGSYDLQKINPNNFKIEKNYQSIAINKILPFNNTLLIGTTDELKQLLGQNISSLKKDDFFNKPVQDIVKIDTKKVLICTDGYGAYITDLNQSIALEETQFLNIKDAYVTEEEIWLATNMGLYLYIKKENSYVYKNKFTQQHGLPTRKINGVLILNNNVMVATDNGIAVFSKNLSLTPQLLDVYIENVYYNSKKIMDNKPSFIYENNNSLNIKIGTINYSEIDINPIISYKLMPNQIQWAETTSTNLTFSDLQPNDYTLLIEVENYKKTYNFLITPLWWQRTSTKIAGMLLAMLVLACALYYIRKHEISKKTSKITAQKKLAEFKLYALRSQMNPHFVFNSLAAIQFYINNNDFETSEKYLVKFSKLIRQFFELSKENEISLAEEIKLLHTYLDIEKLRFKEKLNFIFDIDSSINLDTCKIPTMLIQPIVENAVNHGIFNKNEKGTIQINFKKNQQNEIIIEVKDDGVGIEATRKINNGKINSSEVLKERLSYLNESKKWEITYTNFLAFPENTFVGNISRFIIKNLE